MDTVSSAPGTRVYRLSHRGSRGFTLIELMMATLVLGILTSISVVSYSSYRSRVDTAKAIADLRLMEAGIEQFLLDNRRLPADADEAGYAHLRDPWGRSYVYYRHPTHGLAGVRQDRRLNPINTDYDLYSVGKDGQTRRQLTNRDSLDDIVRANNGAFIGLAANF